MEDQKANKRRERDIDRGVPASNGGRAKQDVVVRDYVRNDDDYDESRQVEGGKRMVQVRTNPRSYPGLTSCLL